MTPAREQVSAIICSVLMTVSVLGLGGVGSVAATDHSPNSTQVEYTSAVAIGGSDGNGMALDVTVSGESVEFGGAETAVVRIRQPSTGASLTVLPDTTERYNVTGFDTQNLYNADGSLKSPANDRLSIVTENEGFTEINVTVSGDQDIFNRSTFARYVVEVQTAEGAVIGETEPGLRGIGYPGQLSQNTTEGTIEVTFPRLSSVNASWYVEYRVENSENENVISKTVTNREGVDEFSVNVSSGRLAEGTYNQDLIVKQNETDPSSQQILRIFGIFDDGLEITDGKNNNIVDQYDENDNGLETSELLTAISDWRDSEIETQGLLTLIDAWRSNSSA